MKTKAIYYSSLLLPSLFSCYEKSITSRFLINFRAENRNLELIYLRQAGTVKILKHVKITYNNHNNGKLILSSADNLAFWFELIGWYDTVVIIEKYYLLTFLKIKDKILNNHNVARLKTKQSV